MSIGLVLSLFHSHFTFLFTNLFLLFLAFCQSGIVIARSSTRSLATPFQPNNPPLLLGKMATAEKTRQQAPFQSADYPSEDDYESENGENEPGPERKRAREPEESYQQQQKRQKHQDNDDADEDQDDEDYFSDEYSDDDDYDDSDNDGNVQGKAIQPYQPGRQSTNNNTIISSEDTVKQSEKGKDEEDGLKLRLDLNLDIEVELKAHIHGDITLSLL